MLADEEKDGGNHGGDIRSITSADETFEQESRRVTSKTTSATSQSNVSRGPHKNVT